MFAFIRTWKLSYPLLRTESQMLYGTIIKYFPAKQYGFIRADTGRDVFFHASAIGACQVDPVIEEGQPVKFEMTPKWMEESSREDEKPGGETKKKQRTAMMVELIEKLPGGSVDNSEGEPIKRHPKARRKKPSWRK